MGTDESHGAPEHAPSVSQVDVLNRSLRLSVTAENTGIKGERSFYHCPATPSGTRWKLEGFGHRLFSVYGPVSGMTVLTCIWDCSSLLQFQTSLKTSCLYFSLLCSTLTLSQALKAELFTCCYFGAGAGGGGGGVKEVGIRDIVCLCV